MTSTGRPRPSLIEAPCRQEFVWALSPRPDTAAASQPCPRLGCAVLCRAGRAATRAVRRVQLRVLTFLAAAPAGSPPSTILPACSHACVSVWPGCLAALRLSDRALKRRHSVCRGSHICDLRRFVVGGEQVIDIKKIGSMSGESSPWPRCPFMAACRRLICRDSS